VKTGTHIEPTDIALSDNDSAFFAQPPDRERTSLAI